MSTLWQISLRSVLQSFSYTWTSGQFSSFAAFSFPLGRRSRLLGTEMIRRLVGAEYSELTRWTRRDTRKALVVYHDNPYTSWGSPTSSSLLRSFRRIANRNARGTKLNGPPNESLIFGLTRKLAQAPDSGIGRSRVVLMERSVYIRQKLYRAIVAKLFGRGLLWAEGESHKRQRKALTPAFSKAAIRRLTDVFYDSAHKTIDNSTSRGLDSIGIAGFSHDFRTLDGEYSAVAAAFDSLNFEDKASFPTWYFFSDLSFRSSRISPRRETASRVTFKTRREKKTHVTDETADRAEEGDSELRMDQTEVMAQVCYETTSISLTWALIELARQPEKQAKLREEITEFGLWVDDVVPVSQVHGHSPSPQASGEVVDSIAEFRPERWLTLADEPLRAKEIQGHRHIISFLDGPRTCLGKSFALAEFKAVLSVLIRNFTFEFPDGPETEIASHRALIPRPKVAGQPGGIVP
ncbi:cytochrome P450 [Mycena olivaceomarginata]|nr:cytochrome P450 [Mycena olivaceomarginata]